MMDDFLSRGKLCCSSFTLENWILMILEMTWKFFSTLKIQDVGEYFVSMDEKRVKFDLVDFLVQYHEDRS